MEQRFLLGLCEVEELVEVLGENGDAEEERPTSGIGGLRVSKALRRGAGVGILGCGCDRPRRGERFEGGSWCRDVVLYDRSGRGCCRATRRVLACSGM